MQQLIEVLQHDYAIRALLASVMVGILCGVLGCFLVLRNMALIGDALSHAILPGIVAGFMVFGYNVMGFFTGSVIAGLLAAVLITLIQRNVKTREDAAIGIVFTSMFAMGVIGISWITRKQGVHLDLKDFLFGNILGISDRDLWLTFLVLIFTILCISVFYRFFFITTFGSVVANTLGISGSTIHYFLMLLLSFAVVASLQSVGVILVVAMLITPASTAYLLTHKLKVMLVLAGIIGVIATVSGLLIAILFETTPGPCMTLTATFMYLIAVLFSPKRGILIKTYKRWQLNEKVAEEDVLKLAVRLNEQGALSVENLQQGLPFSFVQLRYVLWKLKQKKLLISSYHHLQLTEKGTEKGYNLVRAHRLWESYLVEVVGMQNDQIHQHAEEYEHLLTESMLEKIEDRLGYPQLDPHGSPIPRKPAERTLSLATLALNQKAVVNLYQMHSNIIQSLWQLGINPNKTLKMKSRSQETIVIEIDEAEITVPFVLAQQVKVEPIV